MVLNCRANLFYLTQQSSIKRLWACVCGGRGEVGREEVGRGGGKERWRGGGGVGGGEVGWEVGWEGGGGEGGMEMGGGRRGEELRT